LEALRVSSQVEMEDITNIPKYKQIKRLLLRIFAPLM